MLTFRAVQFRIGIQVVPDPFNTLTTGTILGMYRFGMSLLPSDDEVMFTIRFALINPIGSLIDPTMMILFNIGITDNQFDVGGLLFQESDGFGKDLRYK
ncbi:hypothetical protein ACQKI4_01940 [Paenibacillus glucanolyticus]|uniref:hypothetical protein n=1 Tax=Paenibacillus glucanolyticus TaxID=59843 RepID=UPI003D0456DE